MQLDRLIYFYILSIIISLGAFHTTAIVSRQCKQRINRSSCCQFTPPRPPRCSGGSGSKQCTRKTIIINKYRDNNEFGTKFDGQPKDLIWDTFRNER